MACSRFVAEPLRLHGLGEFAHNLPFVDVVLRGKTREAAKVFDQRFCNFELVMLPFRQLVGIAAFVRQVHHVIRHHLDLAGLEV